MSKTTLVLRKSFFDELWPLILEKNPCDTYSKNTSEFFTPQRKYDDIWAHTLLAKKCFQNYKKPIELDCTCTKPCVPKSLDRDDSKDSIGSWNDERDMKKVKKQSLKQQSVSIVERESIYEDIDSEIDSYRVSDAPKFRQSVAANNDGGNDVDRDGVPCQDKIVDESKAPLCLGEYGPDGDDLDCRLARKTNVIISLPDIIENLEKDKQKRNQLAEEFINRQFPWYTYAPIYERAEEMTGGDVRDAFTDSFDFEILRNINAFACKLLIIDIGGGIRRDELEHWMKFCRYGNLLFTVRCPVLARQIQHLRGGFYALEVEENLEKTWQEELMGALCSAVVYAKELKLHQHCAQAFIFSFGKSRRSVRCDEFRVLRKF